MQFEDEYAVLENYIKRKGFKKTPQRGIVMDSFLSTEKHIDVESLYNLVKQKAPSISLVTVYRTLKLLCECNLAIEMKLGNGITRYEHKYNHKHHDHLICIKCGRIIEFCSERIEEIQNQIANGNGFIVQGHRLEITGICEDCK